MPFVQAKCPECGGMLAVDDSKKAAVCQFCGEAFIVQEAVNNYITNNITNNTYNTDNRTTHNYGEGAVVNVYEDTNKDFVIEGGVLKKYQGASLTPVIPEGVVAIEGEVFRDSAITKVTLPSTLKELRCNYKYGKFSATKFYGPFYNCSYLEEVNLPEGLKEIGSGAFCYCSSLKSIIIPESVTHIGAQSFYGCKNITSVTIPNSVIRIEEEAFRWCSNLESLIIPDSVETINFDAFSDCKNLTSVTVPASVITIGNVFKDTPYYKEKQAKEEEKNKLKKLAEEQKLAKRQRKEAKKQRIITERKNKGLCQHCGGTFKGLFFSKCSNCGKPKDY